jgi:transcriptional regulator with XRE-family HTH domain
MVMPYGIEYSTLNAFTQEGEGVPDTPFRVAHDIGRRLAELRELLEETQKDFAARFGRGWKQVSMWERGHQRPRPSVLSQAADRNCWPLGIFEEGGPRPATIGRDALKRPAVPRSGGVGDTSAPRSQSPGRRREDIELRSAALRHAAGRLDVLLRLIQAYRDAGRPASPEILAEWLEIAAANASEPSPPSGGGALPPWPQAAQSSRTGGPGLP